MVAGFVATVVISMMMLMKKSMGIMPRFGLISMLQTVTDQPKSVDWLIHFLVGIVVYGLLIALLAPILPFDYWLDGIVVGLIGWMLASLTLMPAAGKGLFGLSYGASAFIMSMMMHAVFGLVLGLVYGWLV
jgi:hypothetical protein